MNFFEEFYAMYILGRGWIFLNNYPVHKDFFFFYIASSYEVRGPVWPPSGAY